MTGQRRRTLSVPPALCRAVPALIGAAVILLSAGCGRKPRTVPPPPPAPTESAMKSGTIKVTDSRIVFPDTGPRVWVAEAESIVASADPGTVKLTTVSCRLYRQGQEALRVRADAGDAVRQGKAIRMTLTGNVRALEPKRGLRLTADTFEWASQYDRVSAVNVQWLGMGFTHRADRGVFSTDLTRADFTGRVETRTSP